MNSCGILFEDELTFAFENGEKSFFLKDIRKFDIKTKTKSTALAATCIIVLFTISLFAFGTVPRNNYLLSAVILLAGAIAIAGVIHYNRKIYIELKLRRKRKFIIHVSYRNKKEASKFISRAIRQKELMKL